MPRLTIHVRGIPGSGKTWLCENAEMECIDTDDVVAETFDKLYSSSKKFRSSTQAEGYKWYDSLSLDARRKIMSRINSRTSRPLLIVGVTLGRFPEKTQTIFIKMSKRDLEIAYRRLLLRELEKITSRDRHASYIIAKEPVRAVSTLLQIRLNIAVSLDIPFPKYQEMYKQALDTEKKEGSLIMTQSQALKYLRGLTER